MELNGKLALVTGAASGIGAATTRLFVQRGARVFAADLNGAKLEALAGELGKAVIPYTVDVSDRRQTEAMVTAGIEALGGLDILVNNAGIGCLARVGDMDPEEWRKVLAVDLDAVFWASRIALPTLVQRRGNIVCTASISGVGGDYGFSAYNAAKGAVINLVRNMAVDYAAAGVRVNSVSPGLIVTGLTVGMPAANRQVFEDRIPLHRAGEPAEIAEAIAFLASARASYITGHNLVVDGGLTAHTGQPDVLALRAARAKS